MGILWKRTVSAEFRANRQKFCENCTFPQNFCTRKLGEIMVFYAVGVTPKSIFQRNGCFLGKQEFGVISQTMAQHFLILSLHIGHTCIFHNVGCEYDAHFSTSISLLFPFNSFYVFLFLAFTKLDNKKVFFISLFHLK